MRSTPGGAFGRYRRRGVYCLRPRVVAASARRRSGGLGVSRGPQDSRGAASGRFIHTLRSHRAESLLAMETPRCCSDGRRRKHLFSPSVVHFISFPLNRNLSFGREGLRSTPERDAGA